MKEIDFYQYILPFSLNGRGIYSHWCSHSLPRNTASATCLVQGCLNFMIIPFLGQL